MTTQNETGTLDFSAHYQVRGYGGIAWYLIRYATEWHEENWDLVCDVSSHTDVPDHYPTYEGGEIQHPECWFYSEPEETENKERVIAVMVGDDREKEFDVGDLTEIPETAFCRDCGQIGCTSNTYE